MLRSILWAIAMVAATVAGASEALADKRVALVMGIGNYAHVPSLGNPVNDAKAVAQALKRLDFQVVEGFDLKADEMRKAVRTFAGALNDADVAWFYYAGHGMQVAGKNYLIPADAELSQESDLDFAAIDIDFVMRQMTRESRVNIIVLDACRDNPLSRTLAQGMGATRGVTVRPGLAEISKSAGTLIAFATEPGNLALDGGGRHSPFTEALLNHMETPNVEIGSMMTRVRAAVWEGTKQKQLPWVNTSLIGEFYLKRDASLPAGLATSVVARVPAPPAAAVFDERQLDVALWNSAEKLNSKAGYDEYLRQFPKGVFAGIARERLQALAKPAAVVERALVIPPAAPAAPPASSEQTEASLKLNQQARSSIQQRLTLLGHDTKGTDGRFGANTRDALKAWQAKNGLAETGYLDQAQMTSLNGQTETAYRQFVAAQAAQAAQRRTAEPPRPEPARTYEPVQQYAPRQPSPPYQPAPAYQPSYEPPPQVYRPPPPPPPPAQDVNPGQMLNTINQGLDLFKRLR